MIPRLLPTVWQIPITCQVGHARLQFDGALAGSIYAPAQISYSRSASAGFQLSPTPTALLRTLTDPQKIIMDGAGTASGNPPDGDGNGKKLKARLHSV